MAHNGRDQLEELEDGLRDDTTSTTMLLQKCILLGGRVGSEKLRDWARQELNGYTTRDDLPAYRRVYAAVCIDGVAGWSRVTGQQISPTSVPEFARKAFTEPLPLMQSIGELEHLAGQAENSISVTVPRTQDLVARMNADSEYDQVITSIYWKISRATIVGVVSRVRTALAELVGELLAALPDDQQFPSKEAVDNAVHLVVTGHRNTVTVVGAQNATNGDAEVTVTRTADQSSPVTPARQRLILIIGIAAVVMIVLAVLQLLGRMPWA